ncbi:MAG: hypothetical protein PVJ95_03340 [Cellvibrionales bacterium]
MGSANASRGQAESAPPGTGAAAFACGSGGATLTADGSAESYTLFESGPVRPLALSPNGQRLAVANAPANCLELYRVVGDDLQLDDAVMVGLEPVAVAFNGNDEVWVVNHLSDSVSIVSLADTPRVIETLQVGDEPRDVVFAGDQKNRAFVSAAFRGQNHPSFNVDALLAPGLGRADVWVFDASQPDRGDRLVSIVNLFADSPRALAVSPDNNTVYAAAFMSGNQTTTLSESVVKHAKPSPSANHRDIPAPDTGLIVKKSGSRWVDEAETDWSASVMLDLPDNDVFRIDASAAVPSVIGSISGVGSTLFNMAVDPTDGALFVSHLDALNHIRFEGPGETATTVRGRIAESGIAVIPATGSNVVSNHLNPHVDFAVPEGEAYPAEVVEQSLSQPTAVAMAPDGEHLYVAALGSGVVAKVAADNLRDGAYQPDASAHFHVPGGAPAGLAVSPTGERLFVYSLVGHSVSVMDAETGALLGERALFSPEPSNIRAGRRFLYDARETSANGTSACASCHIFGDMDQLAWDLGNPDADLQSNDNAYVGNSPKTSFFFHPMKGPMTTQTLRGISDSGPQHWRGDRTGENRVVVDGELESLEAAAFKEFNPAFVELLGRTDELPEADMQAFTDFAMALTPPPNPVRNLDNSLTPRQANGRDIYFSVDDITGLGSCNHCHTLAPELGNFGTAGLMTFEGAGIDENFKVPHFRNAYAKVGMFGTSGNLNQEGYLGDQIKGFGYLHDGSIASLADFFASPTFQFPEPRVETESDVVRFVLAADSNLAPIVGQQVTLSLSSGTTDEQRLDLMEQRALVTQPRPECDLIVRGVIEGQRFSALYVGEKYQDSNGARHTSAALQALVKTGDNVLTFTCTPVGSGSRLALDTPY